MGSSPCTAITEKEELEPPSSLLSCLRDFIKIMNRHLPSIIREDSYHPRMELVSLAKRDT